ncbi:GNAT family N-acetyltransferase [Pseudoalteromonas sp. T1lg22]|uniref:GNAT family N-acetyltransferase n=1 Tax=Pseudoalteromonas sp. T1lg22 TaxID=2077096 RepID=UPI000CF5DDCD|nr:GNAT family N-acetyltransferase [Pseudoalteromonas sp. T1lg22]
MTPPVAQRVPALATPLVNKFYDRVGARGRANKQDQLWVVRCDNDIVAAARVSVLEQQHFLCGVFVEADYRRQGLAATLIRQVCAELPGPIYSFIYQHLRPFYEQLGFATVATLPEHLASRLQSYRNQGRDVLAYCYQRVADA